MSPRTGLHLRGHPHHHPGERLPVVAAVAVGGAGGAVARFRLHSVFPRGAFAAGAGAALSLGFVAEAVAGGGLGARLNPLLATGFCGALPAWSAFSYELLTLNSARRPTLAAGCPPLTVGAGAGLSFAGATVARAPF